MSKIFPMIESYLPEELKTRKPVQRIRIISVEGNIGAGKSSFLKKIQEKYGDKILFLQEPVDIWETVKDGENILQKYYKDPVKYAFAFQVLAFTTRLQLLKDAMKQNKVILMERSLEADYHVFTKMLADDHILNSIEFQIYEKMKESVDVSVDKVIWLNTSVGECAKRIKKRARVGEETISEDYLRKCDLYHRKWLKSAFVFNEADQKLLNDHLYDFRKLDGLLSL